MQPHENGPWRKNMRRTPKRDQFRYVPTEELIRAAEGMLAESAQLAREAGMELHQTSLCTNALCSFIGSGYWIHCPNGHPVVCGELTTANRDQAVAAWN